MKKTLPVIILFFCFFAGTAVAEEGINKEEIRALLGETQMMEQNYPEAARHYREVLKKDPSNVKARTQLADVLSWQGQYAAAISEYQEVLRMGGNDFEVKKKLATVYSWQKDFSKAEALYLELVAHDPTDIRQTVRLAEVFFRLGKAAEAERLLKSVLEKDPGNTEAKVLLAETAASQKNFAKAEGLYREVLAQKYDRGLKAKLGDVLSWARRYDEAIKVYDELLAEKDEKPFRLQKARILGWARNYGEAEKEYRRILEAAPDDVIQNELEAKKFYWDQRVKRAIASYKSLLLKAPGNVEAMFDLSQICAYQSMWQQAIEQYRGILGTFAGHFRAREGLQKAELISTHPVLASSYEYFKARSSARDVDIRKNVFSNRFYVPLSGRAGMELGYDFAARSFADFHDLIENQARIAFDYRRGPDWAVSGFFNLVTYSRSVAPVYEFGGQWTLRTFDVGQLTLSQEQRRLENNSTAIRERLFHDDFKARQDIDISRRLKVGTDYTFSYFSDHNQRHEVAADTLFYFTLEPKAFFVKYRYAFRDFRKSEEAYFSPQNFSLHTVAVRWKHFLNKEEIFFGAKDLAYEVGYDFSIDSTYVISHQVSGDLVWDISQRFQIRGGGQYTHATSQIYEDVGAKASLKYYF